MVDNKYKEKSKIQSNKWQFNTLKAIEEIILLNPIKTIKINIRKLIEGSIIIFSDNMKIVNEINNSIEKATKGV